MYPHIDYYLIWFAFQRREVSTDPDGPNRNGRRDVPEVREMKKEHMTVRLKKEGDSHGRLVFLLRENDIRTDSEN